MGSGLQGVKYSWDSGQLETRGRYTAFNFPSRKVSGVSFLFYRYITSGYQILSRGYAERSTLHTYSGLSGTARFAYISTKSTNSKCPASSSLIDL